MKATIFFFLFFFFFCFWGITTSVHFIRNLDEESPKEMKVTMGGTRNPGAGE